MAEGREAEQEKIMKRRILLIINCIMQGIGVAGGPLAVRLYFLHGGNRVWLSCLLQSVGFPILLVPLFISYIIRRRRISTTDSIKPKMVDMKLPLFVVFAVVGVLNGLDNILYSYGLSSLPVSTAALIIVTQLAFTAIFAFFMVRQKFTAYSVNAVILLILGPVIMAVHANADRPAGESTKKYVMGFVLTLVAAVLYGFVLPLVELVYKKTKQAITYSLVLEIQLVVSLFATLFAIVGMIINKDFKVISREARHFGLGETNYYVVLVGSAILWQLSLLGSMGVIFCASSLLSGILIAVMVPVTEVLAVIFYKEKFQAEKGISLILCLWGFISYFYGEYKQTKRNRISKTELPQNHSIPNP